MTGRRGRALVAVAVAALVGASGTGAGGTGLAPDRPSASTPSSSEAAAHAATAARRFLDAYVDADGRVVRHDQGGDTVSEGQAYAMLLAAAVGDADAFDQIRRWTEAHLVREDGLMAFRWADGAIADPMPATDADLLAAAALVLGAERFGDRSMRVDAARLADAIVATEIADSGEGPVLLAGPWAHADGVVNPSYFVVPAMSVLAADGDHRWAAIAATSRRLVAELTADPPHLPPDWAALTPGDDGTFDGGIAPRPAPGSDDPPVFGYEAVRLVVQLAADCDPAGRDLAARMWPFLREEAAGGTVNAAYLLDGTPARDYPHPAALVAAAAAAHAAGDRDAATTLLDAATELDELAPSYYGAVWVALARLWLDTDRLDVCA